MPIHKQLIQLFVRRCVRTLLETHMQRSLEGTKKKKEGLQSRNQKPKKKSKKSSTLTLIAFGWSRHPIILVVSRQSEFIIHFCLLRLKRLLCTAHGGRFYSQFHFELCAEHEMILILFCYCWLQNKSCEISPNFVSWPTAICDLSQTACRRSRRRFVVVSNRIENKKVYLFIHFILLFFSLVHCRRWSIRVIGGWRYMVCGHRSAALSFAHIRPQIVDIDNVNVVH